MLSLLTHCSLSTQYFSEYATFFLFVYILASYISFIIVSNPEHLSFILFFLLISLCISAMLLADCTILQLVIMIFNLISLYSFLLIVSGKGIQL